MTALRRIASVSDRIRLRRVRAVGPDTGSTASATAPVVAGDALARLARRSSGNRSVVLLVPSMNADALFAGLWTAIDVAGTIAARMGCPLRIRTLDAPSRAAARAAARSVAARLGGATAVDVGSAWTEDTTHQDDVWVPTYFSTAHAIDRACERGVIDRDRVVYLVQDHEPSFFPASTESVVAAETYRCGFRLLVNSEPLRRFLVTQTDACGVTGARTFRPALDVAALRRTAADRARTDVVTIGFYARPGKPRNGFEIGRAALQIAARDLAAAGIPARFRTMGAAHAPFAVAGGRVDVLGRLLWADSFQALARTDVLLSLQLTPHPSHPPLDAVVSGGWAVTNELGGSREALSPRLTASAAAPHDLAAALRTTAVRALEEGPAPFDDDFLAGLGRPLDAAVDDVLTGLL